MKRIYIWLMMFAFTQNVMAQISFSGKITDATSGEPVPAATIQLENTFIGTVSDFNGNFTLNRIREADTVYLLLSHLSYETQRVAVSATQNAEALQFALQAKSILSNEVVVSAIRADKSTPTTFTTVTQEEISKNNLGQDLPWLLDQTPSIVTTSDAGAGVGYTSMRIRGSDQTRINVTVNGIPLNDPESQGVFWVNMPDFASSIDNVQIQRGVGTSTNGAAAFGATVDLQTAQRNDSAYAELNNSYGSFNTWKHTLKAGTGLIKNKFAFDARLSRITSDGYVDRATSDLKSFFVSGAYYGKTTIVRANVFSGVEKTYQAWWGVPQDLLQTNRTYNYYNYPNETDNYQQDHYQLFVSQEITKKLLLNAAGHYTYGRGYYEQYRGPEYNNDLGFNSTQRFSAYGLENVIIGNDTITRTSLIRQRWLDNHFYGMTYSLKYDNLKKWNLTVGGAWNVYDGAHFGEIIWAQYASNGAMGHRFYDNKGLKKDRNMYAKWNYFPVKKIGLFLDVQYRNVDYSVVGTEIGQATLDVDVQYHFFNPKAGLSYKINQRNNLYASFAIGNREPVRRDFIDNPLNQDPQHETLRNLETGYQFASQKFSFVANYFLMHYKNQLVLTGELNDVGAFVRTNVPVSYRIGIELQAQWKIHRKFWWSANFTYSENKIKEFTEYLYVYDENYSVVDIEETILKNRDIALSPRFIGGSIFTYMPVKNIELAFITKYVGKQFLDNTQNEERQLNAYVVNNFRVVYRFVPKKNWMDEINFHLLLNNIFNTLYENNGYTLSEAYLNSDQSRSRVDYNYYYPQAGFNFMLGVGLKF